MTTFSTRRTSAILLRQIYLMRGSVARLLPLFAWVAIDMVLWGFITKYLNSVSQAGLDFVPTLLGAVLLWDFCARVMHGVTTAFLEDVWSRNFLNLFASPLSIAEYVIGLMISSVATSAIGLLVMLVLATTFFGLSFFSYGAALVPFLLILFSFGIALGVSASALVLWLGPASEWFIWPIPALVAPFAGVFYPVSTLPRWMQYVARALPPAPVFEGMRNVVLGRGVSMIELSWGGSLAVAYLFLACWFFTRIHRRAVRVGLIARYSAENLS
jgi:ABC-2 type transport system permease protein